MQVTQWILELVDRITSPLHAATDAAEEATRVIDDTEEVVDRLGETFNKPHYLIVYNIVVTKNGDILNEVFDCSGSVCPSGTAPGKAAARCGRAAFHPPIIPAAAFVTGITANPCVAVAQQNHIHLRNIQCLSVK